LFFCFLLLARFISFVLLFFGFFDYFNDCFVLAGYMNVILCEFMDLVCSWLKISTCNFRYASREIPFYLSCKLHTRKKIWDSKLFTVRVIIWFKCFLNKRTKELFFLFNFMKSLINLWIDLEEKKKLNEIRILFKILFCELIAFFI